MSLCELSFFFNCSSFTINLKHFVSPLDGCNWLHNEAHLYLEFFLFWKPFSKDYRRKLALAWSSVFDSHWGAISLLLIFERKILMVPFHHLHLSSPSPNCLFSLKRATEVTQPNTFVWNCFFFPRDCYCYCREEWWEKEGGSNWRWP